MRQRPRSVVDVACPLCGAASRMRCFDDPPHRGEYHSARWAVYDRQYPGVGAGCREVTMTTFFRRITPKHELPPQLRGNGMRAVKRMSAACKRTRHGACYVLACICSCHSQPKGAPQ